MLTHIQELREIVSENPVPKLPPTAVYTRNNLSFSTKFLLPENLGFVELQECSHTPPIVKMTRLSCAGGNPKNGSPKKSKARFLPLVPPCWVPSSRLQTATLPKLGWCHVLTALTQVDTSDVSTVGSIMCTQNARSAVSTWLHRSKVPNGLSRKHPSLSLVLILVASALHHQYQWYQQQ